MERNQLGRGWKPYLHPVYASHPPNAVGLDLEPREEERPLWGSIFEHVKEKRAQNTAEPKVPHSSFLTLTELMFHVAQ